MSSTIDNRVVEMNFDNQKFESNVKTSVKSLDTLKKSLNLSESSKSLNDLAASGRSFSLANISDGVDKIASRFSTLGIIGMTVLQNLTNSAIRLGQQMLNTVILGPLKQGFAEYETQMNAIQTVLANTQSKGTTLTQVNAALDQLNTYADKTIYNFTEMTRNIGTFTAAGIDLNTSVSAIKGIANLAAVSGSNSQQASTAMYQLSQALASGTVKLMDWNSVVNAGMGGQVFQDALKETARVHGIAIDNMIKSEGSFRETLQKGWLTSEILTETLSKFTGDLTAEQLKAMGYTDEQIAKIIVLGQTANDAATKVKTFSQLKETLMEALQSGWARSWQIIIGDFEEAKAFMTEISDIFSNLIGQASDSRNKMLENWKILGGRTDLIAALRNTFKGLQDLLKPISEGIREVIAPLKSTQLVSFTKALRDLTAKFKISDETARKLKATFSGIASIFSIVFMAVSALAKGLGRLITAILPGTSNGFLNITSSAGGWLTTLQKAIVINDTFNKVIDKMAAFLVKARDAIKRFVTDANGEIQKYKKQFVEFFAGIDLSGVTALVNKIKERLAPLTKIPKMIFGIIGTIFGIIKNMIQKNMSQALPSTGSTGDFVQGIFASINKALLTAAKNMSFNKIFDAVNGGLIAALLVAIRQFVKNGSGMFDSIGGVFKSASGILNGVTGILNSVRGSLETWQKSLKAKTLMTIALSIAILAAAVIALSLVDSEKLTAALVAIGALFAELVTSMMAFEKVSGKKGITKVSGMMISLALSMLILAGALSKIGKMDKEEIIAGVLALEVMMASMVGFALVMSKNSTSLIKGTGGFILFALALDILTGVVKKLGSLDVAVLTNGLIGIGVLTTELAVFMKTFDGSGAIKKSVSILVIAGAISVLGLVVKEFGKMDADVLTKGLVALGALFAELSIFINTIGNPSNMLLTSISLVIVAGALSILSGALSKMGNMTWDEIGRGLSVLAGSLIILTLAMYGMQKVVVGDIAMLLVALAITVLGSALKSFENISIAAIGKGLLALVGVFVILGLAALVLTPVIPALLALGGAILLLGIATAAVGAGVLAFSAGLAALVVAGGAGGAVLITIFTGIIGLVPLLIQKVGEGLVLLLQTVKTNIPLFLATVDTAICGILDLIVKDTPLMVNTVLNLITTLLTSIATKLPEIVQAGFDILIGFLQGIENNIGELTTTAIGIVTEFLNAIATKLPDVIESGWNLIIAFVDGLTTSVTEKLPELMTSVGKLGKAIVEGIAKGISENVQLAIDAIGDLGTKAVDSLKEMLGIHSPSTVTDGIGVFLVKGLVNGIARWAGNAYSSVRELGKRTVSNLGDAIRSISDSVSGGLDLNPTIRPVIDLTDVTNGKKQLSDLFGDKNLNLGLSANNIASISSGISSAEKIQNGSNASSGNSTNIELTQINNSPVALSRIEIYRQTQIQLNTLKGLVGNT